MNVEYLVLFLAILVAGGLAVLLWRGGNGRARGGNEPTAGKEILGLSEPDPVLPPVLLPPRPRAEDVDAVRFSVALRGYRCDQVDAVLDVLGTEIERLSEENRRLRPLDPAEGSGEQPEGDDETRRERQVHDDGASERLVDESATASDRRGEGV